MQKTTTEIIIYSRFTEAMTKTLLGDFQFTNPEMYLFLECFLKHYRGAKQKQLHPDEIKKIKKLLALEKAKQDDKNRISASWAVKATPWQSTHDWWKAI